MANPTDPAARLADLMRQGFMKPRKARAPKVPAPMVACELCQNWHRRGKHTASKATRDERAKQGISRAQRVV